MFFKNAIIYQFTQHFNPLPTVELEAKLATVPSRQPSQLEASTYGFSSPTNTDDLAIRICDSTHFIQTKKTEKIIPAQAVNEILNARINTLEEAQNRKLSKKERAALKDDILAELLPNALTKSTVTNAYLDYDKQLIVVDASSAKRAEDLLSYLRKAIGSLPVVPLQLDDAALAPHMQMTRWLLSHDASPKGFNVEGEAHIQDVEGRKITVKNADLFSPDIQHLFAEGAYATKLALTHDDTLTFVLTDALELKRIKPLDIYSAQLLNYVDETEPTNEYENFVADATINLGALRKLIDDLGNLLGGYAEHEQEELY